MRKTGLVTLCTFVLFAGGILAGQLVRSPVCLLRAALSASNDSVSATIPPEASAGSSAVSGGAAADAAANAAAFAGADADETMWESSPEDSSEKLCSDAEDGGGTDLRREAVETLIRHSFPAADENVVDEWAEALQDLPDEEVQFILAQKQQLSSSGGGLNPLPDTTFPDISSAEIPNAVSLAGNLSEQPPKRATLNLLQQAVEQTLQNLQGVHLPGYRCRHVVLPTAGTAGRYSDDLASPISESAGITTLTRFDIGPLLETGNPLHVCLPADRECFFCLEPGPLLTRRGDFSVLADRTLGLMCGTVAYSLPGPIRIPETAVAADVTREGTVRWRATDGEWIDAGKIPVMRIRTTETLESDDGVLFTVGRLEDSAPAESSSFSLDSRKVELSNVDAASEWATLEHFRRLEQELSRR